jgi:hypothetical protein
MKVMTLHQPYATLVAFGVKTIETRGWATNVRGRIAIHAAAKRPPHYWCSVMRDPQFPPAMEWLYDRGLCVDPQESSDGEWWCYRWAGPLGAIVATAELVDCLPMVEGSIASAMAAEADINHLSIWLHGSQLSYVRPFGREPWPWLMSGKDVTDQLPYGDYAPGRFAWLLKDVEPLAVPVPFRGGQGWSKMWEPAA